MLSRARSCRHGCASSPSPGGPLGAGGLATLWFSCPQKTAFPCQASVYRSASRVCGPRAHGHVLIRDVYPMDVCLGKSPAGGLSRSTVTSPHPTPPGTPRPPFQSSFQGTPLPQVDELPACGDDWPLFPPRTRVEGRKRTPLEPRHCPRGRAVLEVRWPRGSAQARLPAATAPHLPEPDATLTGPAAPRS